ncbi:hypothetical protein QQ045_004162 [Rhodiola kirilowii]
MDKSWLELDRGDSRYVRGLVDFVEFAKQNGENIKSPFDRHPLSQFLGPPLLAERYGESSSGVMHQQPNPTMNILQDQFAFQHEDHMNVDDVDSESIIAYERAMQLKVESRLSDKGFDKMILNTKAILPPDNNYPGSYKDVKKILKKVGLGYETIHACENGCILYYKEFKDHTICPVCGEERYTQRGSTRKVPKKTVKYFPLTPRLQCIDVNDPDYIRHPADGEAWKKFDSDFPEFASEIRNVQLGLSTDDFNPFGASGLSHGTWPIIIVPYNLPPHICMKKELNILCLLISGPKSPGKCLNVFMRSLIDELKSLWDEGAYTFDRHDGSTFIMKAAVMSTISDFPGLGMLGGAKTKGYKACPICLDEIDSTHLTGQMLYQGHQRWLPKDHEWRFAASKFNGNTEFRDSPSLLLGPETFQHITSHEYSTLSLHPQFKSRGTTERLCWTHMSIFYELPYWQ